MGRITIIIVIVVSALVLSGLFLVGLNLESRRGLDDPRSAHYANSYPSSYYSGPEWDQLREYQDQGSDGWSGLEGMMSSTDDEIVRQAASHLCVSGLDAIDHFLRGLPTISATAKHYVGMETFDDAVWQRAVEIVQNNEAELLEGAAYFLRIENSDLHRTSLTPEEVGDVLVASIPNAAGVYADVLPQTLGFYPPQNLVALTNLLKSKTESDRLIAVSSLGKLGLEETLPDVRRLKTDSSKTVRAAALIAEESIDAAVLLANSSSSGGFGGPPEEKTARDSVQREKLKKKLGMP